MTDQDSTDADIIIITTACHTGQHDDCEEQEARSGITGDKGRVCECECHQATQDQDDG